MTTLLDIRNLSAVFPGRRRREPVRALSGLTLTLERGESLSVIGESGSGKTTLMRCILGHVLPSEGSITLFGQDTASADGPEMTALRRRCAMVSQDPYGSLPPTLTVLEAAMEPWLLVRGKHAAKEGEERARNLLAELGLRDEAILSSRVRLSLSGGQRQRVAIARALILDPELLLCDEPTSMQDASTRGEIIEILAKRQRSGMSMIFVTHDLFLARKAALRGIVLHKGTVVEEGFCRDILSAPKHPYTRALVAALPRLGKLPGQESCKPETN
ncbi:MAG: ABC transporter ATP-binding protein [Synergistales bacterium]|nr:ABC transporter ATP-binding protein [Synergistales bacterium]